MRTIWQKFWIYTIMSVYSWKSYIVESVVYTSTAGWAGVDIFFVSYSGSGSFLHSALIKEPFKTNPQGLKWDSRSWHPSSFQNATLPYFEYEIIFYLLAFLNIENKKFRKKKWCISISLISLKYHFFQFLY